MKRSEMIELIGEWLMDGLPQDKDYLWKHNKMFADSLLNVIEEAGMLPRPKEVENNRIFSGPTAPSSRDGYVIAFEWEPEDED